MTKRKLHHGKGGTKELAVVFENLSRNFSTLTRLLPGTSKGYDSTVTDRDQRQLSAEEKYQEWTKQHPNFTTDELGQFIKDLWKTLPTEERLNYETMVRRRYGNKSSKYLKQLQGGINKSKYPYKMRTRSAKRQDNNITIKNDAIISPSTDCEINSIGYESTTYDFTFDDAPSGPPPAFDWNTFDDDDAQGYFDDNGSFHSVDDYSVN
ncbi:hypothetical protein BC941DRAFT_436979 [Chlamydoabsidia padenii]|nr:hypothetical protein BC941DRAFT_436979 [Chlamydoabsidia padenii]